MLLEIWKFIYKLHWNILIDFDWKIKICCAEIACTNFKYFEVIEKYRSGYRYSGIDTWDWYRNLGIEKYRFLNWVLWSGIEKYRYLNLVSKGGIEKYRYLKKVSIPNPRMIRSSYKEFLANKNIWWKVILQKFFIFCQNLSSMLL